MKSKSRTYKGRGAMGKTVGCAWMYPVLYTWITPPLMGEFVVTAKYSLYVGHHLWKKTYINHAEHVEGMRVGAYRNFVPPSGKVVPVTAGLPPCSFPRSHIENLEPYAAPILN